MQKTQTRIQSSKNTRQMDNHWDHTLHGKPWIAPGVFPLQKMLNYEHDDSGLGVVSKKIEKLKNFKELYEINEQVTQQQQTFRKFKEYDNITDGELIITIEYCTNCHQHQGSTRHDEEKYYNNAIMLKQELIAQYPIAKVYLKPLVYDALDTSVDSLCIQRRIGALEVQACSKNKGEIKKGTVFSKLVSRTWPDIINVFANIVQFLSTSKLDIYVTFGEGVVGDLSKIDVVLTPYRQSGGSQRTTSRQNTLSNSNEQQQKRPQSNISRQSASSKRSKKAPEQRVKYVEKTDNQGVIRIAEIPIDVYIIEVSESNDYQAESFVYMHCVVSQLLNMFEMSENNQEMSVIINLKKQIYASIELRILNDVEGYISDAKVEIFNKEDMTSVQAKESHSKGTYELVVEPGRYIVQVTKKGLRDHKEEFTATKGQNKIKCEVQKLPQDQILTTSEDTTKSKPPPSAQPLKPLSDQQQPQHPQQQQQQQQKPVVRAGSAQARPTSAARSLAHQASNQKIEEQPAEQKKTELKEIQEVRPISGLKTTLVFIYDPYTNLPIRGVVVKLNEESTKKTTTYTTDEDGTCKLILQNILEGKLVIESEGYFPIVEDYGTAQSKMNLYQLRELSFPLIKKPSDANSVQILVQTNVEMMPIDLKLISPDNLLINDNDATVSYDYNEDSGCLKITINQIHLKRGVYRIFADILEPEFLHPQTLKLYIITTKELKLVDVPKGFSEEPKFWDIGVVCAPNTTFLEINSPTNVEITRDKYLKDFQELLNFLMNSKNMDLKTILGFNDKEKLEVSGDVFVQKDKIKSSLDKYGFESMKHLDYLIASAMMPNGLYSYKRLEQKFNHLDFEFIFDEDKSTSKQKDEEGEDEPYDEDYDL